MHTINSRRCAVQLPVAPFSSQRRRQLMLSNLLIAAEHCRISAVRKSNDRMRNSHTTFYAPFSNRPWTGDMKMRRLIGKNKIPMGSSQNLLKITW